MARMLDRVGAALGLSFVLAISGGITGCGGSKADTKTPASEGGGAQLSVGSPAPDLSIQTINGKGKISINIFYKILPPFFIRTKQ